ncbi:MAG: D-alanine--D-alanine ligase A, partial [Candidatus Dadabacteria bacterium]
MNKNVAIFFGGQSAEHEVSLQSAVFVTTTLKKAGFSTALIGITKDG